jgi:hypothetical protein
MLGSGDLYFASHRRLDKGQEAMTPWIRCFLSIWQNLSDLHNCFQATNILREIGLYILDMSDGPFPHLACRGTNK